MRLQVGGAVAPPAGQNGYGRGKTDDERGNLATNGAEGRGCPPRGRSGAVEPHSPTISLSSG